MRSLSFVTLLCILLPGPHGGPDARQFDGSGEDRVSLAEEVSFRGQESFRIRTRSATYYYHKKGAGLAAMIDRDGNDWLGYRPEGGSEGRYRGIPNLVHPEGYFHPGGECCVTVVRCASRDRITLYSESTDGKWACTWDFFPDSAQFNLLRAAGKYWFLYEGTPGGRLDKDLDYWTTSEGGRRPVSEDWHGDLPFPEWVSFGDPRLRRVLFIAHHSDDDLPDQFYQMEDNMTVFGFGRQYLCCEKYLSEVPARYTVAFIEDDRPEAASAFWESIRSASDTPCSASNPPPESPLRHLRGGSGRAGLSADRGQIFLGSSEAWW